MAGKTEQFAKDDHDETERPWSLSGAGGLSLLSSLEYLDQGICVFDHGLNLVAHNRRFRELLGVSAEDCCVGKPISAALDSWREELEPGKLGRFIGDRLATVARSESITFGRVRADGTVLRSIWHALPDGGFVATYADITARRRADDDLRRSEQNYRNLIDNSPQGIIITQDRKIVYANQAKAEMHGYALEEMIGMLSEDLLHPDDLEDATTYRAGSTVKYLEIRGLKQDGSEIWMTGNGSDMEWEGRPSRLLISSDISHRKAAEAQLRQARKMETVGQLTGGIAHDFNNFLTIIMGNLELLMETLEGDTARRKLIANAIGASRRGASLVQRLLAFSRRQILDPEPTDINSAVSGILDFIALATASNVTVETRLSESLWSAMIDADQLENALINLATNARDAMPDGGSMIIETTNVSIDDTFIRMHPYMKPGDYVALAVRDSGTGMTEEVIAQAFDPFFTTKEVGKGSGLGLSMIYGFIKQSGGYVTIDSAPGAGTTITLYLPREACRAQRGPIGAA